MQIYRHMEADGVPAGYDRWLRIGVVRHPLQRLWSLYKFLEDFGGDHDWTYIAAMRQSVQRPFEEWLLRNQTVFTSPYDHSGAGRFWPAFTCRHPLPENRKSQFLYLRPDLGTTIVAYEHLDNLAAWLGVTLGPRHNGTRDQELPDLTGEGRCHMERIFAWDYAEAAAAQDRDPWCGL